MMAMLTVMIIQMNVTVVNTIKSVNISILDITSDVKYDRLII